MLRRAPDVLVLGAGGTLGDAWTSAVLMGIEDAGGFDAREAGCFVGTSAGSIVASYLAAGVPLRERLRRLPDLPGEAEGMSAGPEAGPSALAQGLERLLPPVAGTALGSLAPGGRLLRRLALSRVRSGRRSLAELGRSIEGLGVEWGGRLRIAAVALRSGRRVVLDGTDPPGLPVSTAVLASCAIPSVFPPVEIGGELHVDGGVWSFTNLDAARVARGSRVLCLNPGGSAHSAPGRGRRRRDLVRGFARNRAKLEAAALRRRGAEVTVIAPDRRSAEEVGVSSMDHTRRTAVTRAGYAQGRGLVQRDIQPEAGDI